MRLRGVLTDHLFPTEDVRHPGAEHEPGRLSPDVAKVLAYRDKGNVRPSRTMYAQPRTGDERERVATAVVVISELSSEARKARRTHGVVLMVELGDLREGIMPDDLEKTVRQTLRFPHIALRGIGTNLACRSGVSPDTRNMSELSALADSIEATFGLPVGVVSGGNSANLDWALGNADTGRVNDLRLGESILLGRETLHRRPIDGLHTDAITLVAEVIESKIKPSQPWGEIAQTAFGDQPRTADRGQISQAILAVGRQDIDPCGLDPPPGIEILGASSDHLITDSGPQRLAVGAEITFQLNYSALVRAMTSPFVAKVVKTRRSDVRTAADHVPTA